MEDLDSMHDQRYSMATLWGIDTQSSLVIYNQNNHPQMFSIVASCFPSLDGS